MTRFSKWPELVLLSESPNRGSARNPRIQPLGRKAARSCLFLGVGVFVTVAMAIFAFQLVQHFDDKKNGAMIQGVVLDQTGKPLSGVLVQFRAWNWRWYVPIPFTSTRIVERRVNAETASNGTFFANATLPQTDFVSASKTGYYHDGQPSAVLPPIDAVIARGSEKIGEWLEHNRWPRDRRYDSNSPDSALLKDYEKVWFSEHPIFRDDPDVYAFTGGWHVPGQDSNWHDG